MSNKAFVFILAFAILLTLPAYAISSVSSRTISIVPDISFDGTEATCTVSIAGDRMTDSISATMMLKLGNNVIDAWSGSGQGILNLVGVANVLHGKTYTLTVHATINGVAKPAVTITRKNN